MRVLVVDDELFICELLDEYLTLHGYQVNTATCGLDAISQFRENRPHIILMDIRMPGMSGVELLGMIKQMDPSIKVIMLSAFGDEDIVRDAMKMGADHFIQKPMKLRHIMEILHGWEGSCQPGAADGGL